MIDFARVQSKVALKYDAWHKEVLGKFGALLGGEMVQFHGQLAKSRSQLEQQTIGEYDTSKATDDEVLVMFGVIVQLHNIPRSPEAKGSRRPLVSMIMIRLK